MIVNKLKSIIYHLLKYLPIRKKSILFISYYGSMYGCNPKYISEWLVNKSSNNSDIIWAFTEPEQHKVEGVKIIKYGSLQYYYALATCRIICTNYRMTDDFIKRPEQTYIQTWHSSLRLKMIERDAESSLKPGYVSMAKHDSAQTDYVIAGCAKSADTFSNSFWYNGKILRVGTPRNDLLLSKNNDNIRSLVKKNLGISDEQKIVLYAPTFRENKKLHYYRFNIEQLKVSLSERFGGEWVLVRRLHPHLSQLVNTESTDIIDATDYDDIQELLLSADILITDYSSLMFDFSVTGRPVFLYTTDLETYCEKERKLYFKIDDLPFPLAKTNEELHSIIQSYSNDKYHKELTRFNGTIGTYERGSASMQVGELMLKIINGKDNII